MDLVKTLGFTKSSDRWTGKITRAEGGGDITNVRHMIEQWKKRDEEIATASKLGTASTQSPKPGNAFKNPMFV